MPAIITTKLLLFHFILFYLSVLLLLSLFASKTISPKHLTLIVCFQMCILDCHSLLFILFFLILVCECVCYESYESMSKKRITFALTNNNNKVKEEKINSDRLDWLSIDITRKYFVCRFHGYTIQKINFFRRSHEKNAQHRMIIERITVDKWSSNAKLKSNVAICRTYACFRNGKIIIKEIRSMEFR